MAMNPKDNIRGTLYEIRLLILIAGISLAFSLPKILMTSEDLQCLTDLPMAKNHSANLSISSASQILAINDSSDRVIITIKSKALFRVIQVALLAVLVAVLCFSVYLAGLSIKEKHYFESLQWSLSLLCLPAIVLLFIGSFTSRKIEIMKSNHEVRMSRPVLGLDVIKPSVIEPECLKGNLSNDDRIFLSYTKGDKTATCKLLQVGDGDFEPVYILNGLLFNHPANAPAIK